MSFLSEALRQYYHHCANKILFKGGLTLNQLAILMWEKLGYREIDASVVSRVINGVRLFTKRQLTVFGKVLNLKNEELMVLQNALIRDILARAGNQSTIAPFFSSEEEIVKIICSLTTSGNPIYAIELSSFFENYITQKKLLAKLYNEKSRAYGLVETQNKVLSYMMPLNKKASMIAEDLRDKKILAKTWMNIGGGFYVGAKWQASADFLESKLNKVDKSTRTEFIRTLLLDYARLGDLESFKATVKKADHTLDSLDKLDLLDSDNIVSLLEALARSFSIFGLTNEAKNVFAHINNFSPSPFYQSQILRGRLFNLYQEHLCGGKIDRVEFKNLLNASQDAKYAPFLRHQKQNSVLAKKLGINYGKN